MQTARTLVLLAAAAGMTLLPAPGHTQAETECAEGRAADGTCADASLGTFMREGARVFAQPRLSYSGPPVGPSSDPEYDVLRDWGQGLTREIYGPCVGGGVVVAFCP